MLKLYNSVPIRYLRILGGISVLLILTRRLELLGDGYLYLSGLCICLFLTILLGICHFFTYHRIKHIYKLIINKELDVYNSPFDRFSSQAARILMCAKGICDSAAPVGLTFGAMAGLDELRKMSDLEPVFLPFLAELLFPNPHKELYAENRNLANELLFIN